MKKSRVTDQQLEDFNCTNQPIEVQLINGRTITGVIIGYYSDWLGSDEQHITGFHIINEKDHPAPGIDALGFMKGEIIFMKDVAALKPVES